MRVSMVWICVFVIVAGGVCPSSAQTSHRIRCSNTRCVRNQNPSIVATTEKFCTHCGKRLVNAPPTREDQELDSAYDHLTRGENSIAEQGARHVLVHQPKNARALATLGYALVWEGKQEIGYKELRQARSIMAELPIVQAGLGSYYYFEKSDLAACRYFEKALSLDPDFVLALIDVAPVYKRRVLYDAALRSLQRAAQLAPRHANIQARLGELHEEKDRLPEALAAFEKAERLDDRSAYYAYRAGGVLYRIRRYAEAARAYRQAVVLAPSEAVYQADLGNAYNADGDYPAAISTFQKLLQIVELAEYHLGLGDAYFGQKNYAQATRAYKRATELKPKELVYLSRLGKAQYESKQYPDAIATFDSAVALGPKDTNLLNWLGNAYFMYERYSTAEQIYRRAIQLGGQDGVLRANLAGALYKMDRKEEAKAEATEAKRLGTKDHWVFSVLN